MSKKNEHTVIKFFIALKKKYCAPLSQEERVIIFVLVGRLASVPMAADSAGWWLLKAGWWWQFLKIRQCAASLGSSLCEQFLCSLG